jgi:hypothetical protein
MKAILKSASIFLSTAALAAAVNASDMTTIEGRVTFDQGDFHLVTNSDRIILTGLSRDELSFYAGQAAIITGETHRNDGETGAMEVYKIQLEKQGELVTLYDWEVVNNELYEN